MLAVEINYWLIIPVMSRIAERSGVVSLETRNLGKSFINVRQILALARMQTHLIDKTQCTASLIYEQLQAPSLPAVRSTPTLIIDQNSIIYFLGYHVTIA